MSISTADKRLYAICEHIIHAQQLDPNLHQDLAIALNRSCLKERYLIDEKRRKALEVLEQRVQSVGEMIKLN